MGTYSTLSHVKQMLKSYTDFKDRLHIIWLLIIWA